METPIIVGLLVIVAVWSFYLLPTMFRDRRNTPLDSANEFDRFANHVASVQRRDMDGSGLNHRSRVLARRRRTLGILVLGVVSTLVLAWTTRSAQWLLVNLIADVLLVAYIMVLIQLKSRRHAQVAHAIAPVRSEARYESQVRLIS